MPLIVEPKANPAAPQAPTPTGRHQVSYGTPTPTTARVEALKQRLNNPSATQQMAAPRVAGSTARQEQYSKQPHQAPRQVQQQNQEYTQPMQDIEPPPSGMPPVNTQTEAPQELAQQTNIVEEQAEPSSEATEKPLSPQFVALAKQERAIRKARQELKAQQETWERDKASYVNLEQLKADPLKALAEAGISYDRLTELQLGQVNPDPNQQLLDKIQELETKLAAVDEQFTKRDTAQYEAAVNQIRNDVKLLVDSDPTFETIKETGETESVVELIRKVFDAEGTILAVEEAARLVEDKLLENKLAEIEKLSKLSKFKSRLGKPAEIPAEASELQQQQPAATTLTNQGTVSRPLSARERAIQAFEKAKSQG